MENQRRGKRNSHSGVIALMLTLVILMVFSVVILFLPEEGTRPAGNPSPTQKPSAPSALSITPKPVAEEEYVAVVLSVDRENKMLTVYGVETGEKKNLVYTGGTTFFDGYGIQITAGQLEIGGLYVFTVNTEEAYISYGTEAIDRSENKKDNGIWEKTGVDSLTIADGKLSFRNQNYRYHENVCVMNDGKQISLAELNTKTDIVTVRGKGAMIYEIVVTKGHGTIALKNHEDFVGGTITIGNTRIDTVTETGTYVVREGKYVVSVTCGKYSGTETVVVARDKTTPFDLFEYGRGPIQVCDVTFTVEPLGATLYIDGVKTAYTDGVQLDYGTYKIEFSEGGYLSYTATLHVDEPSMHLSVYLKENEPSPTPEPTSVPTQAPTQAPTELPEITQTPATTVTPTETPQATPTPLPETGRSSVSIQEFGYQLDLEYAIYVIEPEGAEVYLDEIYLGLVPIDFEKIIGPYELMIIRKDGTISKYQCEGKDDGTDSWYSFP